MGGKKKKGLSNRLAKMSDEERARYLQHRAAIEEEAKRRKEQLIATYMKNKLKREEAFTRLNIAKINEHWHQILRKIKIQELKTEIKDLSMWITKIIDIKNSIIRRLMQEMEESEEQYEHNLKNHLSHVDGLIDMHHLRQNDVKQDFETHRETMLEDAVTEMDKLMTKGENEEKYLKTVLFTMETKFKEIQKQMKGFRDSKLQDYSNSLKADHETMVKSNSVSMDALWRDINSSLREYLGRTTVRRHHYIELRHLDERNAAERKDNERRIDRHTEIVNNLKTEYDTLYETNEGKIKDLKEMQKSVSKQFHCVKQNLTAAIRKDANILREMTVISNTTIKKLEKTLEKGNSIQHMMQCCRRLETEDEKLLYWAKLHGKFDKFEESVQDESTTAMDKEDSKLEEDVSAETLSEDTKQETVTQEVPSSSKSNLPEVYNVLEKLDGLWWCCNRVEVECMQMRNEKQGLILENKNLKDIIKGILKDAALEPPTPPCSAKFPVTSKIKSAPPVLSKQSSLQTKAVNFIVIDL